MPEATVRERLTRRAIGRALPFALATLLICLGAGSARAATWYVAPGGSDSAPGTPEQPFQTFAKAFTRMASGDTLILRDGTYTGQQLFRKYTAGIPAGTPSNWTVIKAEHPFQAVVDKRLDLTGRDANDAFYIRIEGIHFTQPLNAADEVATLHDLHHVQIMKCSFEGHSLVDNRAVVAVGTGSSYVLFEDCFAWGGGRYKFLAFADQGRSTSNIIFRRCVARHDFHTPAPEWGRQEATFTMYDAHNVLYQNCISIDSGDADPTKFGQMYGGFFFENKGTTPDDNSGKLQGCIILNVAALSSVLDYKCNGNRAIVDTVAWHVQGGMQHGNLCATPGGCEPPLFPHPNPSIAKLSHLTFGDIWGTRQDYSNVWGIGVYFDTGLLGDSSVTDTLVTGAKSGGILNLVVGDYRAFHKNGTDYANTFGVQPPKPGDHDLRVDPKMKYITRIEADSPLKGAASDGGDIGANVLYRWGVSGTLYGEPGYDVLTQESLWPFPYEDEIKKQMSTWPGPNDGKRGFCAEGNGLYGGPITLTSYIWEYLGNPVPPEILMPPPPPPPMDFSGVGPEDMAMQPPPPHDGGVIKAQRVYALVGGCGCQIAPGPPMPLPAGPLALSIAAALTAVLRSRSKSK